MKSLKTYLPLTIFDEMTIQPQTSLFTVVQHVVRVSGLIPLLCGLMLLTILSGIVTYYETQNFTLMVTSNEPLKFIDSIMKFQLLSLCLNFAEAYMLKMYFTPSLYKATRNYMWTLISHADPSWVCEHGNFTPEIEDAILAVKGIITNFRRVIRPFVKLVSQILMVVYLTGIRGFYTLMVVLLIVVSAVNLIQYNFKHMKEYEEKRTKRDESIRTLSATFAIQMLDGMGKQTIDRIVNEHDSMLRISLNHEITITGLWHLLDGGHSILVMFTIYKLSQYIQEKNLVAVAIAIYNTCTFIWWCSHEISALFENASKWGAMEKLLKTWKPLKRVTLEPEFSLYDVIQGLSPREMIRIHGKSGGGKTSWMVQTLIKLYRKYSNVQWSYLDQKMKLNMEVETIREIMQERLKCPFQEFILFNYADKLGLSHLINLNTLDKPFKNPSGGEEKRILLLAGLLPILHNEGIIKVLFLDEVTTGLDPDNFHNAISVIDEIRQMGIAVIIIDHHEFESVKPTKEITVNKKIYNVPQEEEIDYDKYSSHNTSFWEKVKRIVSVWWDSQLQNYQQVKTDDKTKVIAWLEGDEEPQLPHDAIIVKS